MIESAFKRGLAELEAKDRLRRLRVFGPAPVGRALLDGRELINFSSNDYLGLSRHPLLRERAREWTERFGTSSAASRLVCGNIEPYESLERRLAKGKGARAALVFPSGFQANVALIPALCDRALFKAEPLLFADKLNHASMHDGARAAGLKQIRYRHRDLDHLETLLKKHADAPGPRFLLSETVFSMDGDAADVAGLIELARRFDAFLYLDDAHADGALGAEGFGLAQRLPVPGLVMGAFSKAWAGVGGYAACSSVTREWLVNRCGGIIYSTGLPPAALGAADAALELTPQLSEARETLAKNAARARAALAEAGLSTLNSTTHIVPLLVGAPEDALGLAAALEAEGLLAVAIRPPTVPEGSSRLRLSFSASHSEEDVERLVKAIRALAPRFIRSRA
jgi:8-amino-7-oxononanoate synthase